MIESPISHVTLFYKATRAIRSQLLFCHERPEQKSKEQKSERANSQPCCGVIDTALLLFYFNKTIAYQSLQNLEPCHTIELEYKSWGQNIFNHGRTISSKCLFKLKEKKTLENAVLGIRSSVFWANHSFFAQKWANERFTQKNKQFAHSLIFGEQPEQLAHGCSFWVSNLSKSLMVTHFWWVTWGIRSHC